MDNEKGYQVIGGFRNADAVGWTMTDGYSSVNKKLSTKRNGVIGIRTCFSAEDLKKIVLLLPNIATICHHIIPILLDHDKNLSEMADYTVKVTFICY